MKKILLLLFFVAFNTYSQNWISTYIKYKDGYKIEDQISDNYENKQDGIITIWQKTLCEKYDYNGIVYSDSYFLALMNYDISNKKTRTLKIIFYSSKGEVVDRSDEISDWDYIIPGTNENIVFNFLKKKYY